MWSPPASRTTRPSFAPYADALRGRSVLCRQARHGRRSSASRVAISPAAGYADYAAQRVGLRGARCRRVSRTARGCRSRSSPRRRRRRSGQHDEPMTFADVVAEVGERGRGVVAVADAGGLHARPRARRAGRDPARRHQGGARRSTRRGSLVLGDEVLTPDSSRFWPAETWQPGGAQPSYDKQYVRDWLAHESGWDRVRVRRRRCLTRRGRRTRAKYVEAYERLTGRELRGVPPLRLSPVGRVQPWSAWSST